MQQTPQNPIKKAISSIKSKYFPTPEQMVADMKRSNAYPNGRAYWSIAPKIVKSKAIEPKEKVDLLLDLYGKYYIYQQKKCVSFAVYENYYEEFVFPRPGGKVYTHKARYDKLYNEMESENSYIINRALRDELSQIISQATPPGASRTAFVESLDERAKSIAYLSMGLENDFFAENKKVFNVYIPSKEESYIKDLLRERFFENHPDHLEDFKRTEPFSEFMPDMKGYKNPYTPPTAIPGAIKDGAMAIMEKAEEIKDATADVIKAATNDKLPEQ